MHRRRLVSGLLLLLAHPFALQAQHLYRITGDRQPPAMAIHSEHGGAEFTGFGEGWYSAQWFVISPSDRGDQEFNAYVALKNRYTGTYLTVEPDPRVNSQYQLAVTTAAPVLPGDSLQPQLFKFSFDPSDMRVVGTIHSALARADLKLDCSQGRATEGNCRLVARGPGSNADDPPQTIRFVLTRLPDVDPPPSVSPAEPEEYVRLRAVNDTAGQYLNTESGRVLVSQAAPGFLSARWGIVKTRGPSRREIWTLKNQWTGNWLEMDGSTVVTGPAPLTGEGSGPGAWLVVRDAADPARFTLKNGDNFITLRNGNPALLVIEPLPGAPPKDAAVYSRLTAATDTRLRVNTEHTLPLIGSVPDAFTSAMWEVQRQPGGLMTLRNRFNPAAYLASTGGGIIVMSEGFTNTGVGPTIWKAMAPQPSRHGKVSLTPQMVLLQNTYTRTYLHISPLQNGGFQLDLTSAEDDEALWVLEEVK